MGLFDALRRLLFGSPEHTRMEEERSKRRGRSPRPTDPSSKARRAHAARRPPPRLHPGLPPLTDREALANLLASAADDPRQDVVAHTGPAGPERQLVWLEDKGRYCAEGAGGGPHYTIQVRLKRSGAPRAILAPRPRLKRVQRVILREILDKLDPPAHAHGFVRGRSTRTHAALHVGRDVLVHFDVQGFFNQFTYRDVSRFFHGLGYPREVARSLAYVTTAPIRQMLHRDGPAVDGVPRAVLRRALRQVPYGSYHPCLPQGAPTSPSLANHLCARLDKRLAALAARFDATYSRYADDLCFSGDAELRTGLRRFIPLVRRIMREERLPSKDVKLRVARKSAQQKVTGLVVNERVSVPTREVRTLRAILHNCAKHGPASQNRSGLVNFREHLRGRIEYVAAIDRTRGASLMAAFEALSW